MGFFDLILRELKLTFKLDPRRATFLFFAAIAYSIIFGILYLPGVVKHVPFIIYDQEQSAYSRHLTERFVDNENFKIVGYVSSEEELQDCLKNKTAYSALEIPKDFSKKIKTGDYSSVLFFINGSNIILTNITSSAAQDIVAEFSDSIAAKNAAMQTSSNETLLKNRISPIHSRLRVLNNPTQSYIMFFLLGLACAAFQQGIFLSVGSAVYGEYKDKEIYKNTKPLKVFACKFLTYWILSIISYMIVVFVLQFFNLTDKSSLLSLLALGGVFSFTAISMSMMFATLFHKEEQYIRASIMYTVPAFIFGGYTWPIESMSIFSSSLSVIFPMAYLSNAMRYLFLSGNYFALPHNLFMLAILGCFFAVIAILKFPYNIKKLIHSAKTPI